MTPVDGLKQWLDIGGEANLPTWWNALLLAFVAPLALLAGSWGRGGLDERRAWYLVAAAATYLSIDEATRLHERLGRLTERFDLELSTYAWLLPGVVLASIGAGILVVAGRSLPTPVGARLGAALAIYASGALGFEALGGHVRDRWDDSWLFTATITIEEGLEMVACILAVGAVVEVLDPHLPPRRGRAPLAPAAPADPNVDPFDLTNADIDRYDDGADIDQHLRSVSRAPRPPAHQPTAADSAHRSRDH